MCNVWTRGGSWEKGRETLHEWTEWTFCVKKKSRLIFSEDLGVCI